jgi:hypothetical protein
VLGNQCPHREYAAEASKFVEETSLDSMLEIAEEAVRKKREQPTETEWVFPEEI